VATGGLPYLKYTQTPAKRTTKAKRKPKRNLRRPPELAVAERRMDLEGGMGSSCSESSVCVWVGGEVEEEHATATALTRSS
jgi:hypothetical protein